MSTIRENQNQDVNLPKDWLRVGLYLVAILSAVVLFFYDTAASMVSVWWNEETFAHGFLIVPISAWLVWLKKDQLILVAPRFSLFPVFLIFISGLGWALSSLAGVLVIQQLAFVSLIITTIWSVIGNQAARLLIFPLLYLFFSVPMGEELVPPMMEFTADFTVELIRMTGIPVYREGLYFSLPSGDWSVVKACSGIRYLIASVTLGTIFAYLTYHTLYKRLLFIVAAIVVPIVANGLRAYIIVMIGHHSDMTLAVGVDHLIYGWLFFGVVIFVMFAIGSRWREEPLATSPIETPRPFIQPNIKIFISGLLITGAVIFWPLYISALETSVTDENQKFGFNTPHSIGNWTLVDKGEFPFDPRYSGYDLKVSLQYQNDKKDSVYVLMLVYQTQKQGKELINSKNILVKQKDPMWRVIGSSREEVKIDQRSIEVNVTHLKSPRQQLLVHYWNWIGGVNTTSDYYGKLLEVKNKLLREDIPSTAIIFATDIHNETDNHDVKPGIPTEIVKSIINELERAVLKKN